MTDFDVEERLAKMREAMGPPMGRKLSFEEQCAAFGFLYGGAKNAIVARTFGLSKTSVSHLSGCLQYDPAPVRSRMVNRGGAMIEETFERDHNRARNPARRRHYETVAREFEAIGEAEFNRRYLTEPMWERLRAARREWIKENGRIAID